MNREQYLETLDQLLSSLPYSERRDIMYDYEEHFESAIGEGQTESEIINALAKPEKIAARYLGVKASALENTAVNTVQATIMPTANPITNTSDTKTPVKSPQKANHALVIIIMSLIMLLLTSILIGPYVVFWVIPIVVFSLSLVGLFGGFTMLISSLVSVPLSVFNVQILAASHPIFLVAFSISAIALGGLLMILTFYMSKGLAYLAFYYFKWCFKVIRGY